MARKVMMIGTGQHSRLGLRDPISYCMNQTEIVAATQLLVFGDGISNVHPLMKQTWYSHLAKCETCFEQVHGLYLSESDEDSDDIHVTYDQDVHRYDRGLNLREVMRQEFYPGRGD